MAVGAARPLGRSLARRWGTFTPGGTVGVRGRRLRPGRRDTLADLTFGFARGLLWAWGSGAVSTMCPAWVPTCQLFGVVFQLLGEGKLSYIQTSPTNPVSNNLVFFILSSIGQGGATP
jgi:hypothetical protein